MDKIEKIRKRPLRSVWKNEAHDFTPWLCANMDYLSEQLGLNNVSSTNYFTQYQRFRRTDVTISSKSPSFYVSPLLNSPLSRGELAYGFVQRIL